MALSGEMRKGKFFLLFFASVFFVTLCDGTKEQKLKHLIKDFKGESDNIAKEIYSWIDKHSKELQSHDHVRHQSRDHLENSKRHKKNNIEKVIKTLKGESDHLANEIYAWIDKHKKSFLSRGKSRGKSHGKSHGKSRGHAHTRDHLRSRRSVMRRSSDDGNVVEGESIQDVMLDLMNAPHPKVKRQNRKRENSKAKKSLKRKVTKKAKHAATKRSHKKGNKKNRISKHVKPVSKKSKIPKKKKKTSTAHVIKAVKKSGGLTDLLKVISADPSKKIVVTKGKNDVTLDAKSLKFFNHIPKPILQRLIEKIELNKYFNIDTYISGEKGKNEAQNGKNGKKSHVGKTSVSKKKKLKKVLVKKLHGKAEVLKGHGEKGSGSAMESSAEEEEENKLKLKMKKLSKTAEKKSSKKTKISRKGTKRKLRKAKKKDERADSKSKVVQHDHSKKGKGISNKKQRIQGKAKKRKNSANIGHQKLAELKDKIKKTNSLKFKVAKALLEHCETQNKLKKVFDNVNASLKEASHLAKAIGKKFGIKKSDLDQLTTKHTEEAVQEFLNKIF